MRRLRIRFTVRVMMIAVAATAIIIAFEQARQRWVAYRELHDMYAKLEWQVLFDRDIGLCGPHATNPETLAWIDRAYAEKRVRNRKLSEFCKVMREKYSTAMLQPWNPVPPDPDPPF